MNSSIELAREVLVGRAGLVLLAVQPDQHGRVDDHRLGQRGEAGRAPGCAGCVLALHQARAAHLLVAGGEMPVPEPRHPFGQRRVRGDHPVQPPGGERDLLVLHVLRELLLCRRVALGGTLRLRPQVRFGCRRHARIGRRIQQARRGRGEATRHRGVDITRPRPETEPVQQAAHGRAIGKSNHAPIVGRAGAVRRISAPILRKASAPGPADTRSTRPAASRASAGRGRGA